MVSIRHIKCDIPLIWSNKQKAVYTTNIIMPSLVQPQSLYRLALDTVFEEFYDLLHKDISTSTFNKIRKYYISTVPTKLREHLMNLAVLKDRNRIPFILDLAHMITDCSTRHLCFTLEDGFLLHEHYATLMSNLNKNNCIRLRYLYIRVILDIQNELQLKYTVRKSNQLFNSLLSNGLGNNLRVLTLQSVCDNELLRRIGNYCIHLKKLNISKSFFVNDIGIKNLCFKNPGILARGVNSEHNLPVLTMLSFKDELNPCCYTLMDIGIQDTNVTNFGVAILLICLKELRTLPGFDHNKLIYHKNIQDAIVLVVNKAKGTLKLNLAELWDMNLTQNQIRILLRALPKLSSLYIGAMHLSMTNTSFSTITVLIVDFLFKGLEEHFVIFLERYGQQLKKINILHQVNCIDITKVALFCPNLVEFSGEIGIIARNITSELCHLKTAHLTVYSIDAFTWIFRHIPAIEHVSIRVCSYTLTNEIMPPVTNRVLKNIIYFEPRCFKTLKVLNIILHDLCTVSKKTIKKLINSCAKLEVFGDFEYLELSEKKFKSLLNYIKRKNFDISLKRLGKNYPLRMLKPEIPCEI